MCAGALETIMMADAQANWNLPSLIINQSIPYHPEIGNGCINSDHDPVFGLIEVGSSESIVALIDKTLQRPPCEDSTGNYLTAG